MDRGMLMFGVVVVLGCARVFAMVACADDPRWARAYVAATIVLVVFIAAATQR